MITFYAGMIYDPALVIFIKPCLCSHRRFFLCNFVPSVQHKLLCVLFGNVVINQEFN